MANIQSCQRRCSIITLWVLLFQFYWPGRAGRRQPTSHATRTTSTTTTRGDRRDGRTVDRREVCGNNAAQVKLTGSINYISGKQHFFESFLLAGCVSIRVRITEKRPVWRVKRSAIDWILGMCHGWMDGCNGYANKS